MAVPSAGAAGRPARLGRSSAGRRPSRRAATARHAPAAVGGGGGGPPAHLVAELREAAVEAAGAGAAVVRSALDAPPSVRYKGATDLVTETDGASEAAVLGVLAAKRPADAVLGEEGGVVGDVGTDVLWCVDPLDGTTNFAHGYPSFAVSVAALWRGRPVAGAVVEFVGGRFAWGTRTFAAAKGLGATCDGGPLAVSKCDSLQRSLLVTGFGYDHGADWEANMALFKAFTDVNQGVRRLGAAAVDLCHVAVGNVDGYWEFALKPYDCAAGVLVASEAGALVTRMDGGDFSVFDRSVLVAGPAMHALMLEKTRPAVEGLLADDPGLLVKWWIPEGYAHAGSAGLS